jgi:hypothetical protein
MDEKHDQTVAMLNDESYPPRTRIDDNRGAVTKVSFCYYPYEYLLYSWIKIVLFKFYWCSSK